MEPREIKIEKNVFDKTTSIETQKKNTSSLISNNNGLSFENFMNDQLNFQFFSNSNTSTENKEEKTTTKTKKTEDTSNVVAAQNMQVKDTNQTQQIDIKELKQIKDINDLYLNIDGTKLSKNDIENIKNLANNPDFSVNINQINGFNNITINYNESGINYNALNFSQNLSEAMQKAYKSKQPIRIQVEKDTSVILKIDKEGKVSANFISSDKAMEMLLRDHIYQLRDRLDKEGLPYKELSYNHQSDDRNKKKDKEDNQNQ